MAGNSINYELINLHIFFVSQSPKMFRGRKRKLPTIFVPEPYYNGSESDNEQDDQQPQRQEHLEHDVQRQQVEDSAGARGIRQSVQAGHPGQGRHGERAVGHLLEREERADVGQHAEGVDRQQVETHQEGDGDAPGEQQCVQDRPVEQLEDVEFFVLHEDDDDEILINILDDEEEVEEDAEVGQLGQHFHGQNGDNLNGDGQLPGNLDAQNGGHFDGVNADNFNGQNGGNYNGQNGGNFNGQNGGNLNGQNGANVNGQIHDNLDGGDLQEPNGGNFNGENGDHFNEQNYPEYKTLLEAMSKQWISAELDHTVSKTASSEF